VAIVALGLALLLRNGSEGAGSGGSAGSGSPTSGTCTLSGLPAQADATVREILAGGPFPYRQDGVIFDNRERRLPSEPHGYYHEFTVQTPGSDDRGARRIIAGGDHATEPDVLYYTGNHYSSFCQVSGAP
jgi:guanyl-specific ribonuclease Sa